MTASRAQEGPTYGLRGGAEPPMALVARDQGVRRVADLIRSGVRLVNVCGPAGVGKSALVRSAVRDLGRDVPAVRLVDLSASTGGGDWPHALAGGFGLGPGAADLTASLRVLLSGVTLLVLDDAEGKVDTGQLHELLQACPELQVVVVTIARVGPVDHVMVAPLGPAEAQLLFVARVREIVPDFPLDERTEPAVGRICEALEGLPLALELAAARVPTVPLAFLERELTERRALRLLSGAQPGRIGVRDCLAATCEHLSRSAAELFMRTGVFEGSFSLDALFALTEDAADGELFDDLTRLVDLRLLDQVPDDTDGARYRVPTLVRELARERLRESGRADQIRDRHADHFASVARRAAGDVTDALNELALPVLRRDSPELWAALDRRREQRPVDALRLAADMAYLADRTGEHDRCRVVLNSLLEQVVPIADGALRRDALLWAAMLGLRSKVAVADTELARERLGEAVALARSLAEPLPLLLALSHAALALPVTHDVELARVSTKEGIEVARGIGHARWRGRFETWTGMLAHVSGETAEAARWGQQGLRRALQASDPVGVITAGLLLHPLPPEVEFDRSLLPSLEELTSVAQRLGDVVLQAHLYGQVGVAALVAHDPAKAASWTLRWTDLVARSGAWHGAGYVLMQTVLIASLRQDDEMAARLHGALVPMLNVLHGGLPPPYSAMYQGHVALARTRLGPDDFDALAADGGLWPWHEALVHAKPYLQEVAQTPDPPTEPTPTQPALELTPREQLVLTHLVAGRRNKEIAALLRITPKSVMHHSGAIYRKLGVRSRAEAAVLALREGLVPPS